jgi:hypothetical protein
MEVVKLRGIESWRELGLIYFIHTVQISTASQNSMKCGRLVISMPDLNPPTHIPTPLMQDIPPTHKPRYRSPPLKPQISQPHPLKREGQDGVGIRLVWRSRSGLGGRELDAIRKLVVFNRNDS